MTGDTATRSRVPLFASMARLPGGLMLVPLVLGVLVNTLAPDALGIGSFTTALFSSDGALTLIALLIVATGAQITGSRTAAGAAGTTLVVLVTKTLIPAGLAVLLGLAVGIEGVAGVSVLALLAIFGNSNGGLWLAFAGQYGDERDRGAYLASAFDDGPFLALIFLGASGLGEIPLVALLAAVVPFVIGLVLGLVDREWSRVLDGVPNVVIPFMSFAIGTGIDLRTVIGGGSLAEALDRGVAEGYRDGYLRASLVRSPVDRTNTGDNTPAMVHYDLVPGSGVTLTLLVKGAGCDNMSALRMLTPAAGTEGLERFVVETIEKAGPSASPPVTVGVGLGGTFDRAAVLAKKALTRDPTGSRSPDPALAELEERLFDAINATGIGPAGFGGTQTTLAVHVEAYPTHIAAFPVAVNLDCHSHRVRTVTL